MPLSPPTARLAVAEGGEERVVALERDVVRLGRAHDAEVRLDDTSVSRRHALVLRRGRRHVILDDRSLDGVLVNGRRVSEAPLHDGDRITLGRLELRFKQAA
jgi:pSer/pThr/pTyr-binding forkhead associated (FHA) protein